MKLLTLDPGETTGYALWRTLRHKIILDDYGEFEGYDSLLRLFKGLDKCVYEDFRMLWPGVNPAPLKVIGAVEMLALQKEVILERQQPAVRLVAEKRTGLKLPMTHWADAVWHGIYWALRNGFQSIDLGDLGVL